MKMTETEINELLAAELTKRSGETYDYCMRFGVIAWEDSVIPLPLFTHSYDTLHLLEELLTIEEWREYSDVMAQIFEANFTQKERDIETSHDTARIFVVLAMRELVELRARVLAEVLRGEAS